jgi:Ca2+/Na+ antiporter
VGGLAIPALFVSVSSTSGLTLFDLGWLVMMTVAVLGLLGRRDGIDRSGGIAILLLYAVFVVVQIVSV